MHEDQPQQPTNEYPESEPSPRPSPRIYVADLAAYNDGLLHGTWLDAAREHADLQADIDTMLLASPVPLAEEWAIHDYDGFGALRLGEYESLATISRLAKGVAEHGPAFAAYADWAGRDEATSDGYLECYRGSWPRIEDYAENFLEDICAVQYLEQIPEWLQPYVHLDVAGFARDLQLGGDIYVAEDGAQVHLFDAHD